LKDKNYFTPAFVISR